MQDLNAKNRIFKRYLCVSVGLAVLAAVAGGSCVLFSFDGQSRYFTESGWTIALSVLLALCAVCSIVALFLFKKTGANLETAASSPFRWLNVLTSVSLVACACTVIKKLELVNAKPIETGGELTLGMAAVLFMFLLCIAYSLSKIANRQGAIVTVSGMAELILCLYIIVTLYFDPIIEINSPFKLLIQFTAASVALAVCAEIRQRLSGISAAAYVTIKTFSAALGLTSFAVMICLYAKDVTLDGYVYLVYSIYFAARTIPTIYDLICMKLQAIHTPVAQDAQDETEEKEQ